MNPIEILSQEQEHSKRPTAEKITEKVEEYLKIRETSEKAFQEELERLLRYEHGETDDKREVEFPDFTNEDIGTLRDRLLADNIPGKEREGK